jgi:Flp pilus assembly protein TadG
VRSDARDQAGSVVVEFALLLPILFVIGLALVQVAVLARDRLMVAEAARVGARAAAIEPDDAAVRAAVVGAAAGLDEVLIDVAVARMGSRGDPVTVRVRYSASTAPPLAGWLLPSTVVLSETATMRQEFG